MLGHNSKTHVFFAVPNALKTFEEGDFTGIIYEHVSYFAPAHNRGRAQFLEHRYRFSGHFSLSSSLARGYLNWRAGHLVKIEIMHEFGEAQNPISPLSDQVCTRREIAPRMVL